MQKALKLSLVSVSFQNVFYNIFNTPMKQNNTFLITDNSVPNTQPIAIQPGFYTAVQLATAIATGIQAIFPGDLFTFALDTVRNRMTVTTSASAHTWTITSVTSTSTKVEGNPWNLLGFVTPMTIAGSSTPTSGTQAVDMNHVKIAYVRSSVLAPSNAFDELGSYNDITIGIPIVVPFATPVLWECKQDILCEINYGRSRPLSNIDIALVDHEGDVLDLQGTDINCEFKIWFNEY